MLASPAQASCEGLIPKPGLSREDRDVTAKDLIQLWEIGSADAAVAGSSPLALSPDGSWLAVVLSRGDLATNSYCRALVLVPVRGGAPKVVDMGGEFISLGTFVRGLWVDTGFPRTVTPAWSPDGRFVAFIRREQGLSQAAVVSVDRPGRRVSTQLSTDVEELWWNEDGRLYGATRPGIKVAAAKIDSEGERGWLYDDRIAPNYGPRPRLRASDAPLVVFEIDPAKGNSLPAPIGPGALPARSQTTAVSHDGRRAWLERSGASPFSPQQLWATDRVGEKVPCRSEQCRGHIIGAWWDADNRAVLFLRQEGWNQEIYALYRWEVGSRAPIRSFATTDVMRGCIPAGAMLACLFENSITPPRIVLVDPHRAKWRTLFDPNPEFGNLRLGTVRRLRFRNDRGFEAWGDLVLPPSYRKGTSLPLILVQYNSRGFLRGGTGNEYPIFPLAAQGFAVLSFERPRSVASADPTLETDKELNAANEKGWAERRSVLSAMLAGIEAAIETGSIDSDRVGITGLSDGATAVRFAIINSNRFSAAAISSCCLEPKTVMTYGGIAWADFNRSIGYPPATADSPAFWAPISIAQNASRINTPLLMQLSDDEYLLSLEAFEALRENRSPTEMFVFPDEHHVKWQPRHKLAVFDRALDWFSFWLRCSEAPDPAKAEQYRRWQEMRRFSLTEQSTCPTRLMTSGATTPRRQPAA